MFDLSSSWGKNPPNFYLVPAGEKKEGDRKNVLLTKKNRPSRSGLPAKKERFTRLDMVREKGNWSWLKPREGKKSSLISCAEELKKNLRSAPSIPQARLKTEKKI